MKIRKILSSIVTASLIFTMFSVCALGAEAVKINGESANPGDTVTYEYCVSGIESPVAGVRGTVTYDTSILEYVDGSIGFDVLNNAIYSLDEGKIEYSAVNPFDGYDFSVNGLVVSLSFTVCDSAKGSTDIKNSFGEFFTVDNYDTDIDASQYQDNTKITVNSYTGVNSAPYLGSNADDIAAVISEAVSEVVNSGSSTTTGGATSSEDDTNGRIVDDYLGGVPNPIYEDASAQEGGAAASAQAGAAANSDGTAAADGESAAQTLGDDPALIPEENGSTASASVNDNSDADGSSGNIILIIIIAVLAIVCIGAAAFLIGKNKKSDSIDETDNNVK